MTLEEYFGDWLSVIDKRELSGIITKLSIEYKSKPICPIQSNVFKAFKLCCLRDMKVLFLGMDPYPDKFMGEPRATGILFGNKSETIEEDLSPSLKVIKEAAINFEVPHNSIIFDPTLESWAKQGILMINSALTVEMNRIGSHMLLWRPFISKLLINLSNSSTGIIYVLFGKQAQTFKPYISEEFNYIFEIEHPAYFARNGKRMPSKLFTDISNKVKELYGVPIKWYEEY